MTSLQVWALLNIGRLGAFVSGCGIILSITGIVSFLIRCLDWDNDCWRKDTGKRSKLSIVLLAIGCFLMFAGSTIPDTKEALLIWGIPKIATPQSVDALCDMPSKLIILLDQYVDGAISSRAEAALKGEEE